MTIDFKHESTAFTPPVEFPSPRPAADVREG
jgi:hypothetical protein